MSETQRTVWGEQIKLCGNPLKLIKVLESFQGEEEQNRLDLCESCNRLKSATDSAIIKTLVDSTQPQESIQLLRFLDSIYVFYTKDINAKSS